MFMRAVFIAAVVISIATTAVIAQSDPIAVRQAMMKENDANARVAVQMMRGQIPFDAAKIEAAMAQWADTAKKFPDLFPDNSKTGGETRAAPKLWESKADFKDKADEFGDSVSEYRGKIKDVEALKTAINSIGQSCDNCHQLYRMRK
jgi:cytochrome c556